MLFCTSYESLGPTAVNLHDHEFDDIICDFNLEGGGGGGGQW